VSFAYPFGAFNATTEAVAKLCEYNNARTVADGPETVPPANAFATRAMPDIQVTAASGPAVTVGGRLVDTTPTLYLTRSPTSARL